MKRFTSILVAALASGSMVLASPAVAAQHRMPDPAGDVVADGRAVPTLREGDISAFRTVYSKKRVRLVTTLRALPLPAYVELNAPLITPSRRFDVFWNEDGVGRTARPLVSRPSGRAVRCPGATARLAANPSRVVLSVPASCLGNPRWIRAGMSVVSQYGDFGDTVDHAGTRSVPSGRGPLSPPVRRS